MGARRPASMDLAASPSQHDGWEALRTSSAAAAPATPSVPSLSFGWWKTPTSAASAGATAPAVPTAREGAARWSADDRRRACASTEPRKLATCHLATRQPPVAPVRLPARRRYPTSAKGGVREQAVDTVDRVDPRSAVSRASPGSRRRRSRVVRGLSRIGRRAAGLEDVIQSGASYVNARRRRRVGTAFERVDTEFAKLRTAGRLSSPRRGRPRFRSGRANRTKSVARQTSPCSFQDRSLAPCRTTRRRTGRREGRTRSSPELDRRRRERREIVPVSALRVFRSRTAAEARRAAVTEEHAYDLPPESFFNASNRRRPDAAPLRRERRTLADVRGARRGAFARILPPVRSRAQNARRPRRTTSALPSRRARATRAIYRRRALPTSSGAPPVRGDR